MTPRRRLPDPPLLVITDRRQARGDLVALAEAVFRGGGRWLSLREKDLLPGPRLALLRQLVTCARGFDAVVTVHADVEAAASAGAAGVHLPAGAALGAVRARLGPEALIGVSAHSRSEIEMATAGGADYITLSPVFASASKPGYGPALGPEGLAELAGRSVCPVIALGGVTRETAKACLDAGAAGLAVMGPVMRSPDPAREVAEMTKLLCQKKG